MSNDSTHDRSASPYRQPAERDSLLAELIGRLIDNARAEPRVTIDELVREHPHVARELQELWATAQFAQEFGIGAEPRIKGPSLPPDTETSPPESSPMPRSHTCVGDYELLERIGEGGMGVVFKARQRGLGRVVALKMIQRGALASDSDVARFRAEAAAAAQLTHPHIVPVYEVGEHDGLPYFSMKQIVGTTLARRLSEGPLSARESAKLLLPIAQAVAHAHAQGIVHRDLKPSNILIDAEGRPHVGDFGLAKRIEQVRADIGSNESAPHAGWHGRAQNLTRTGAILGTPAYMSPEQAAGSRGDVGPLSDVYSLGAVLYHCLTGRPPFQAPSPVDVVMLVLEQDPVAPRVLNPKADVELEMIALKCLQKPPELRYVSATALADDLAAYIANEPIAARSTNITQLLNRVFRETHHAVVLENWGVLWMWHSLVLLILCLITNWLQWRHVEWRLPYLSLWIAGIGAWAGIFWSLRRRGGPITFVERQIAHVWGASMVASSLLFAVETLLKMPVLTLSPVLPLIAATVFVIKAGILSGAFYAQAIVLFATALAMAWIRREGWPDWGLSIYGIMSALCFFLPGWKYYKQRLSARSTKIPSNS